MADGSGAVSVHVPDKAARALFGVAADDTSPLAETTLLRAASALIDGCGADCCVVAWDPSRHVQGLHAREVGDYGQYFSPRLFELFDTQLAS